MDSCASWIVLATLTVVAGIALCIYVSKEYDKYLYKRQHGWQ